MAENRQAPEVEETKNDQSEIEEQEIIIEASDEDDVKASQEGDDAKIEPEEKKKKKSKKHAKTYSHEEMETIAGELLQTQKQRDEFLDMAQRQKAEFDNFRKRSGTQRLEANGNGTRDTIAAILPVIDNMNRALIQCEKVSDEDPLKQGITMVFKQLDETLKSLGLEKINALGESFDPNFHHAVVEGEASDAYPADTVMEVLQDGYIVKDKIIRYVMVKVAK